MSALTPAPARPAARAAPRLRGPALILVGNALIGLLLAATSGAVLLAKMRPPLEDELLKRSAAACRATAADLEYAVMVGDQAMAGHGLERLRREPSVQVAGAWLMEQRELLSSWRRDGTSSSPPPLRAAAEASGITQELVEARGWPHALVSCPVEALEGAGAAPVAVLHPDDSPAEAGRLWLLVDAGEISGTVRRGFAGALGLVSLAVLLAVGLQLAIALLVIGRLKEGVRRERQMREELQQAQKLEAVGRLAAGIAHEINTPIQFIGDNTTFLQEGLAAMSEMLARQRAALDAVAPEGTRRELAQAAEQLDVAYFLENSPSAVGRTLDGVNRVATIVRAMKEFAHPDQKEEVATDLNRALAATLEVARNEYKYVADVVTDFGEIPLVLCLAGDLNQVFLNLVVNAAHAIQDWAKGAQGKGLIRVQTRREGEDVVVGISDTGGGIPEAIRDKIFEQFFTTKEVGRGTGQGLAIARTIVARHGGQLLFDTEVGKGTTFFVRLPIERRKQTATEPAA